MKSWPMVPDSTPDTDSSPDDIALELVVAGFCVVVLA